MYGNKLAAAIKVNGKILREFKDTVYIPFGSEYEILIKNLHTTRAVVNVYIDGNNVSPGGLVINAGSDITLERSIENGNLTKGNRFKFIERTSNIENHRGIKIEDGLIRLEYQFEVPPVSINTWSDWQRNQILRGIDLSNISGSTGSKSWPAGSVSCSASYSANNVTPTSATLNNISTNAYLNDTGITVPGSKSDQSFKTTYVNALESTTHNLVFKLAGDLGINKPVEKPVTVKHKPKCVTCGKQNKAHAKFCTECGTALEIFA